MASINIDEVRQELERIMGELSTLAGTVETVLEQMKKVQGLYREVKAYNGKELEDERSFYTSQAYDENWVWQDVAMVKKTFVYIIMHGEGKNGGVSAICSTAQAAKDDIRSRIDSIKHIINNEAKDSLDVIEASYDEIMDALGGPDSIPSGGKDKSDGGKSESSGDSGTSDNKEESSGDPGASDNKEKSSGGTGASDNKEGSSGGTGSSDNKEGSSGGTGSSDNKEESSGGSGSSGNNARSSGGTGSSGNNARSSGGTGSSGNNARSSGGTGSSGNNARLSGGTGSSGNNAGSSGGTGSSGNNAGSSGGTGSSGNNAGSSGGTKSSGNNAGSSGGTKSSGNNAGSSGGTKSSGNNAGSSGGTGSSGNNAGSSGGTGSSGNNAGSSGDTGYGNKSGDNNDVPKKNEESSVIISEATSLPETVTVSSSGGLSEYSPIPKTNVSKENSNNYVFPAVVGAAAGVALVGSISKKDEEKDNQDDKIAIENE